MRIGVVTTSYPRWPGDPAGGFVADHVRWLARRGHQVEVLAAGDSARPPSETPRDETARVRRVPAADGLFYAGGGPEALAQLTAGHVVDAAAYSLALAARTLRRSARWEGVVAHWLIPSATAAALATRACPLVGIAHSGDVHLLCRTRLAAPAVALLRARGARLVFVARGLREQLARAVPSFLRRYVEASLVTPMGIDVERFRRAAAGTAGAASGDVLFLGRLVPVKGIHDAIDAASRWCCGARLVIAGAGPAEAQLRAHAASIPHGRVHFSGQLEGEARDRRLATASALLLPSVHVEGARTEGMPVTALEAMAARVPVVASRVGGLAELPEAVVTAVPPANPDALAAAVDQLAANQALRERQIQAGEAFARAHDWSIVGPRLCPHRCHPIRT